MASITNAYQALRSGSATPTDLNQIALADDALVAIDRIRDLTVAVNRRKLRILAEEMVLARMNDEALDEAIIHAYSSDKAETHEPLLKLVETLATPVTSQ